jgi:hypothetical protein
MSTELYKAIKTLKGENLDQEDKEELLRFFVVTKSSVVRNQIALILSDAKFNKAIPTIIDKIKEKELSSNNGSLVYALENLDVKEYFIEFVKMICELEYEPRYQAYEIVNKVYREISGEIKDEALAILQEKRILLEITSDDKGPDSSLIFVEQTIELLNRK